MFHDNKNDEKNSATGSNAGLFTEAKSKKIPDSISAIPHTRFDRNRYEKAKNQRGIYETSEQQTHIDLQRLHAPGNNPGSGFGMAKFRELVERSIALNCPGSVTTTVSTSYGGGSPHLFYLYMGMVPTTRECDYLEFHYGSFGSEMVRTLSQCTEWSIENIKKSCVAPQYLMIILSKELKVPIDNISLEDIPKNKNLILSLLDKKLDYFSEVFIPTLLEILAADPQNKYPDTRRLGSMQMRLTEEGFARWKYVIENDLEFVPFKNLEHLNLTAEQKAILQEILTKQAGASVRP